MFLYCVHSDIIKALHKCVYWSGVYQVGHPWAFFLGLSTVLLKCEYHASLNASKAHYPSFLCPRDRKSGGGGGEGNFFFPFFLFFFLFSFFFKILTMLITFEQWVQELWYFTWIFPVIRLFRGWHYFLPCDLDLGVWPIFWKL